MNMNSQFGNFQSFMSLTSTIKFVHITVNYDNNRYPGSCMEMIGHSQTDAMQFWCNLCFRGTTSCSVRTRVQSQSLGQQTNRIHHWYGDWRTVRNLECSGRSSEPSRCCRQSGWQHCLCGWAQPFQSVETNKWWVIPQTWDWDLNITPL